MMHLSVLDLLQCLFWGAGVVVPICFSVGIGKANDEAETFIFASLAVMSQVAVMICAYKAGS